MKRFGLVRIFAALFITSFISQTQAKSDWPPDPAEIFAEGIQWEIIPEQPPRLVEVDNQRRVVQVRESVDGEWREYPFPDEISTIDYGILQPDGIVWLRMNEDPLNYYYGDRDYEFPGDVLLLDTATGRFEEPPTVCHGEVVQTEPGEWVAVDPVDEAEKNFLCHSSTGEIRDVLPENIDLWEIFASPDGRNLVLIGKHRQGDYDFQISAYSLENDRLIALGTATGIHYASVCGWVSDTQGLVCTSMPFEWTSVNYYAFDVTQPNSLGYGFDDWRNNIYEMQNPPRYGVLESDLYGRMMAGGGAKHDPCMLSIYDAAGLRQQEVGYDCIPVKWEYSDIAPFYRHENILYYLTIDSEDMTISYLRSYDVEHDAGNDVLFRGEIESIVSVSPDGRYVVILMDDSGELDFPWRLNSGCPANRKGWEVVVLDTSKGYNGYHGEIAYNSEPVGLCTADQMLWLDEKNLVFMTNTAIYKNIRVTEEGDYVTELTPNTIRRVTFDGSTQISIVNIGSTQELGTATLALSTGGHYWLRADDSIIDLRTFQPVQVFRDGVSENYDIGVGLVEGDFHVRVASHDDSSQSVEYRVMLPG